ncbi:MAG: LamG domain-containing protein, partial [Saprospiraceae bacterium]
CHRVMNFDGVNDYLTIAQNGQYIANDLTVSVWVKPERTTGIQILISNGTEFEISLRGNQIGYTHTAYGYGYQATVNFTFSAVLPTNEWRHITLVRDTNNEAVSLYINGQYSQTLEWNANMQNQYPKVPDDNEDYPLILGAGTNGLFSHFKGCLDDVKIWNIQRSASEIATDVTSEPQGTENGLLAYYDFEQGQANGDNTTITGLNNTATAYLVAIPNNLNLSGIRSNIIADVLPELYSTSGMAEDCTNNIDDNGNGIIDEKTLALQFDGTDDNVSIPGALGNFGTGDFTIEMQVKTAVRRMFFLSKRPVCLTNSSYWDFQINPSGYLSVDLRGAGGSGGALLADNLDVADNLFHHFAITRANGVTTLYVDGIQRAQATINADLNNSTDISIGLNDCTQFNFSTFDGEMDELRFWNYARSATEIDDYKYTVVPINSSGLLAYYDFNNDNATAAGDNTGQTTLTDHTGNYNGTLNSFALTGNTSNWIANPEQNCVACNISPALTSNGAACTGDDITFTATPANESNYHFFADANQNGVVDNGESLQDGTSDTYTTNTLSNVDVISVLVGNCAIVATATAVVDNPPTLIIDDPVAICPSATADLTSASVTVGSDAGTLAYFTDAGLTGAVGDPTQVPIGTYYISLTA